MSDKKQQAEQRPPQTQAADQGKPENVEERKPENVEERKPENAEGRAARRREAPHPEHLAMIAATLHRPHVEPADTVATALALFDASVDACETRDRR